MVYLFIEGATAEYAEPASIVPLTGGVTGLLGEERSMADTVFLPEVLFQILFPSVSFADAFGDAVHIEVFWIRV